MWPLSLLWFVVIFLELMNLVRAYRNKADAGKIPHETLAKNKIGTEQLKDATVTAGLHCSLFQCN